MSECPFCRAELPINLAVGPTPCPECGNYPSWDDRPLALAHISPRMMFAMIFCVAAIVSLIAWWL